GLVAPASVALVGFLMFGNLLRECGVLNSLSETAQNALANLITILLGMTVASQMTADKFVRPDTILILALGLFAFVFDTAGGVLVVMLLGKLTSNRSPAAGFCRPRSLTPDQTGPASPFAGAQAL